MYWKVIFRDLILIFRVLLESKNCRRTNMKCSLKMFVGGEFLVIETSEFLMTKSRSRNRQ